MSSNIMSVESGMVTRIEFHRTERASVTFDYDFSRRFTGRCIKRGKRWDSTKSWREVDHDAAQGVPSVPGGPSYK